MVFEEDEILNDVTGFINRVLLLYERIKKKFQNQNDFSCGGE
jgi:hypothetical protein